MNNVAERPLLITMLMIPGQAPDAADQVALGHADAYLLDLEDTVPAAAKDEAVRATGDLLSNEQGGRVVYVRVHSVDAGRLTQELDAIVGPSLTGINLPKVESAADVIALDSRLAVLEAARGLSVGHTEIMATIETARGVRHLNEIAAASPRLRCLCVGVGDLTRDLGLEPQGVELSPTIVAAQIQAVFASAAAGLQPPHDSTYAVENDLATLCHRARATRALGFRGKHALHAAHLPIITEIYTTP
ncbi:HpcH/HpaI aldolase/citrate lyase family protein [Rhizomonospora bruguierae]|uniref:HpcH/HpaI aldolase/citrate lyase family protein n=1 Tax=Rhizomonospora bruguierae TaxID=1581705 RepID=UPI001BCB7010|nr:aldolase/citrate lyase family protein [Micromonospora sp. NBRC 107566]